MGSDKATKKATKKQGPKLQRWANALLDPAGNKLAIVAQELKDGKFRSTVLHRVDKKSQRGMTQIHETFAAAKARAEQLVADATRLGWAVKTKAARKSKPTFETIPAPAAKPATQPKPIAPIRRTA